MAEIRKLSIDTTKWKDEDTKISLSCEPKDIQKYNEDEQTELIYILKIGKIEIILDEGSLDEINGLTNRMLYSRDE